MQTNKNELSAMHLGCLCSVEDEAHTSLNKPALAWIRAMCLLHALDGRTQDSSYASDGLQNGNMDGPKFCARDDKHLSNAEMQSV